MKTKTSFVVALLLSCSLYSQTPEKDNKVAILFSFETGNAVVTENGSDFRIPTAGYSFDLNYKLKYCYLGLGVKNNEVMNLSNLTFKAIEVPVFVGTTLGIGESYNSKLGFDVEFGGFYKIPYDAKYNGNLDIKNTIGMFAKLGVHFDLSKVMFMRLNHVASYEYTKLIDDNVNNAEFKKSTAFVMSVGFWLW